MTSVKRRFKRWRRRIRRNKYTVLSVLGLIALLSVYGAILARDVLAAKHTLDLAQGSLNTAAKSAKDARGVNATVYFKRAEGNFLEAREMLNKPSLKLIEPLPIIGHNIHAVTSLATAGTEVARTGQFLSKALACFPSRDGKPDFGLVDGTVNLRPFIDAQPYAKEAATHALLAGAEFKKVPHGLLLPLIDNARDRLGQGIEELKNTAVTINKALDIMPTILGSKEKRSYFLAIQNNAELRATGGLIGNYGIITVENGTFSLGAFDQISALIRADQKPAEAPQDFADRYSQFKGTSMWQNVNMSPDFPTVSKVLLGMYKDTMGEDLDGVISIDPIGLKYLLKAIGPVYVPDIAATINAGNVVNWTLVEAYDKYQVRQERKDSLKDVSKAIWERILSGKVQDRSKLPTQFVSALQDKHLMLFSTDREEQKAFESLGYAGALKPTTGDYLQVLMQNHSANKIDTYLHEDISYQLSLNEDGSAHAKAIIKITNNAPKTGLPPNVAGKNPLGTEGGASRTYLSLYVPKGAQLMDVTVDGKPGEPEIGHERDKTVFSHYLSIEPGSSTVASFSYDLPKALVFNNGKAYYILDHQAQQVINHATMSLSIELPKGFDAISLPAGARKQGRRIALNKTLVRDDQFVLGLSRNR